ncbi:MAG: tetratricopeptide repeat protein [Verrucomicrobiota bacterium]|jgi:hypothetical protein|nr:tetratricopeptide repeat protein [Verrucomicrobiota bacterium]
MISSSLNCLLTIILTLLVGCQTPVILHAPEHSNDPITEGRHIIAQAPTKDKNLWRLRVALLALKQGRHTEARELFNTAMPSAGTILKGDASTRKAQSLFSPEERKSFHGEPYERTMGWFYRGIIYWMDGEPENARACFRTAQLMDALAEKNKFRADWVLLDYLDGMVTAKLGDDSSGALSRARIHAGDTTLPEYNINANVMIFLQFGFGPVKKSGGDVGEKINYDGGFSATRSARIRVESQTVTVPIFDDLTYQANTRGRRAMDSILTRKASVKRAAAGIGDVGIVSGAILTDSETTRDAGLTLLGVGLTGKAVGGSVEPRADTRTWNNLPQYLSFASLELPTGRHEAVVEFLDSDGNVLPNRRKNLTLIVDSGSDTVVFVADQ